jgi:hypothetical protein
MQPPCQKRQSQSNQGLPGAIHKGPDRTGRVFRNNREGFVGFATKREAVEKKRFAELDNTHPRLRSKSSSASTLNMKRTISLILVKLGPFKEFPNRGS